MNTPAAIRKVKQLLTIDSDSFDQWLLQKHVEHFNITSDLVQCKSGGSALRYLQMASEMPDAILMDIRLQDMTCYQFLEEFEKLPEHKRTSTHIIIQSAYVGMELDGLLAAIPHHQAVVAVTVKPFTQFTLHYLLPRSHKGLPHVA